MARKLTKENRLYKRLDYIQNFIFYNIFWPIIPLLTVFFIRNTTNVGHPIGVYTTEIIFFGISSSIVTINDINRLSELRLVLPIALKSIRNFLLFSLIIQALLFMAIHFENIHPLKEDISLSFRGNVTFLSLILCVIQVVVIILAQNFISIKGK